MLAGAKIRVLVVDDSAFFRRRICDMLQADSSIEVIGTAPDGMAAVRETKRLKPDVVTMDVEMPVMDGITAVRQIMAESPTAILMFSSLTHQGARATLDALSAGAADFLPKQLDNTAERQTSTQALVKRVTALAMRSRFRAQRTAAVPTRPAARVAKPIPKGQFKLVLIGASTGGPMAIQKVLKALPGSFTLPVVLIVHMPAAFTPAFAERLNNQIPLKVKEAGNGDLLQRGCVYLAPGGKQLVFEQRGTQAVIQIKESVAGQTYKPCVDISFGSAARVFGNGVLGVVLTGMGADGKQGAQLLKQGGSSIWSQDEASCIVYGMPQAVESSGISDLVLPLDDIGPTMSKVG